MESLDRVTTRAELLALGHNDEAIRRALKKGTIDYVGPGLYGPPDADGTREDTHRDRVHAWCRKSRSGTSGRDRALAEVSAAAVLGLPLFGLPLNQYVAHDFSRSMGSRSTRRVRLVTDRRPRSVVSVSGVRIPVVSPARTVIDVARRHERIPAVVVGDAALHRGLCRPDELLHELDLARGMSGVGRARVAVDLMDGRSESVLESRSRIELLDAGLPVPELQATIFAGRVFLGRVDFWWPEFLLVGEADGDLKYRDDPGAAYREKQRSDRLNQIGIRLVRWNWRHVNEPAELDACVRAKMSAPREPLDPSVIVELAPRRC